MATSTDQAPQVDRGSDFTVALMVVVPASIVVGLALAKPALMLPAAAIVAVVAAARYVLVRVHHRP